MSVTSGSVLTASSLPGIVKAGGRCVPWLGRLLAMLHFFLTFRPVGGLASSTAAPLLTQPSFGTTEGLQSSCNSSPLCLWKLSLGEVSADARLHLSLLETGRAKLALLSVLTLHKLTRRPKQRTHGM